MIDRIIDIAIELLFPTAFIALLAVVYMIAAVIEAAPM